MQITRESMFALCEELGEETVKNKLSRWRPIKAKFAQEWLSELESKRETSRLLREEQREEESLDISKRALELSEKANSIASKARSDALRANKIAISAIILSIITAIIVTIIQFILSP